ncbi:MAG: glycerol-3-phosphate acyltransferase [Candidatus Paceibacterota bacterium]
MIDFLWLLVVSYIIGSISPGYFFGKVVKNIDVRNYRNGNTGASNTYHLVGPVYGIIAGLFDALKAVLAYFIALRGISFAGIAGVSPDLAITAGLAAVAGHIWPFYLGFRGGRGAASLAGLGIAVIYHTQSWYAFAFLAGSMIYGLILNRIQFQAPIRKFLKLGGAVFPLSLLFFPDTAVLKVLMILLIVAASFDIIRFLVPGFNAKYLSMGKLSKRKERGFLSGYTLFLLSSFVVLYYFTESIAVFALLAFIFGDLLAPIGKDKFLPVRFIKDKTLGGALIVFTMALLAGLFLRSLASLPISMNAVFIGAFTAAVLDQFSFAVDDNILVPIGTALILTLLT